MKSTNIEWAVSELTIGYKHKVSPSLQPKIGNSKDAYNILLKAWDNWYLDFFEEFKILVLSQSHKVLGVINISSGGVASTVVDPKKVFSSALVANASGLILAHNHPSGNLKPSEQDIKLTKVLVECGALLQLRILDHLIISSEGFYSMSDECTVSFQH